MSVTRFHVIVVMGWFTTIIVVLGVSVAIGVPVTIGEGISVLLAGCVPALVFVAVLRGAPPRTISQLLYDLDHSAGRPEGAPMAAARTPRERVDRTGPPDASALTDVS